jgi:hypothetical protein
MRKYESIRLTSPCSASAWASRWSVPEFPLFDANAPSDRPEPEVSYLEIPHPLMATR